MTKFGSWINRRRHNRGFGIQSPSAFFFITQVLREKLPYYAYETLDEVASCCSGMRSKRCRMLFRIANWLKPDCCISVGSAVAACAIGSARRNAPGCLITAGKQIEEEAARHLRLCCWKHASGEIATLLKEELEKTGHCGMLYIGNCSGRKQLLETALRCTDNNSVIIIEGIYKSKEAREVWQQAMENPQTTVTYDLYSMGIVLFDKEKQKQNYILKI